MQRPSPLETWAERNPSVRWPLVLVAVVVIALLGGWLQPTDF
jgi:hypothetical protein